MDHHDLEAKAAALAEKNRRTERRQWSEAENSAALVRAKETHEDPEKLDMLKSAFELFDLDGAAELVLFLPPDEGVGDVLDAGLRDVVLGVALFEDLAGVDEENLP